VACVLDVWMKRANTDEPIEVPFGVSVNYRRSCLSCCWSKGVEWPAKRCYVGLVAVGVQEQAEDILVPPLLRNCLALNYISFS